MARIIWNTQGQTRISVSSSFLNASRTKYMSIPQDTVTLHHGAKHNVTYKWQKLKEDLRAGEVVSNLATSQHQRSERR